jgi:hypothetical protein
VEDGTPRTRLARIGGGGTAVTGPVNLSDMMLGVIQVGVAWTGSELGYAWQAGAPWSTNLRWSRFSATGTWITPIVYLTDGVNTSHQSALAWTGSTFGASWNEVAGSVGTLKLVQVGPTGVIDGAPVQVTTSDVKTDTGTQKMVWTGTAYGVAWIEDTTSQVYLSFVGPCD